MATNRSDTFVYYSLSNIIPVIIPRGIFLKIVIVIIHLSRTRNRQHAIHQRPDHVFAAGTAGDFIFVLCLRVITAYFQSQDAICAGAPQGDGIAVVDIGDARNAITAGGGAGGTGQEQAAVFADGAGVGVGHVCKVMLPVDLHHIPHVRAAVHIARNSIAGHIAAEFCHVAQVHEGLGIALADHIGAAVAVKDGNQLPGIDIRGESPRCRCGIVIFHQCADFLLITHQLLVVRGGRILSHDALRIGRSGLCRTGLSSVRSVRVSATVVAGHSKLHANLHQIRATDLI